MKDKIKKYILLEIKFMSLSNLFYLYYWFKIKTNRNFWDIFFFWLHSILVCIDGSIQSKSGDSVASFSLPFFLLSYILCNRGAVVIIVDIAKRLKVFWQKNLNTRHYSVQAKFCNKFIRAGEDRCQGKNSNAF